MSPEREKERRRILANVRRNKAAIAAVIQDCESYNENNRWGVRIDPDPGGVLARRNEDLDRILRELAAS